jgi:YD repeat-containing protein
MPTFFLRKALLTLYVATSNFFSNHYKHRIFVTLLLICLSSTVSFCQTYYMKSFDNDKQFANEVKIHSPVAAAFAEYVVNPVGYYTGVPQIDIPIYNIKLKDFSLPVTLSYHAGGIKIDEMPSSVGLGWNLNAGGVITRAVKDKADDWSIDHGGSSWVQLADGNPPSIEGYTQTGNGLLWALGTPSNANYNGFTSYNIDLSSYTGSYGTSTSAENLLKKFYGVAYKGFTTSNNVYIEDTYLLSMVDKEPDIFYFNFAGMTGSFFFDVSSGTPKIKTIPYRDWNITYTFDAQKRLASFVIIDENGIAFHFNSYESTTHKTTPSGTKVDDDKDLIWDYRILFYESGNAERSYRSSWFLTRIQTPLGDYLDLAYTPEDVIVTSVSPQQTGLGYYTPDSEASTYNPNDVDNYGYHMNYDKNEATINTLRLSSISNADILIDFNATFLRDDLEQGTNKAYAIDEIVVKNKIGTSTPAQVRKVKLSYDYFVSAASEPIYYTPAKYTYNYDQTVTDPAKYYKRLRLLSVQEFGSNDGASLPAYTFEYKYVDFTNNQSHRLPHRLSFRQDIWGYYNGAINNKTLIPQVYVYPTLYPVKDSRQFSVLRKSGNMHTEYILPGADRLPNVSYSDIGVLTKINYPTAGFTEYEYENHTFRYESETYSGAGLRIKKIVKNDANGSPTITTNYGYVTTGNISTGEIMSMPVFAVRNLNFFGLSNAADQEFPYKYATTRFSVPQNSLATTNGSFVGYRMVTESITGNGKTVYYFSMPATASNTNDLPVSVSQGECDPLIDSHCDGYYSTSPVKIIAVPLAASTASDLNVSTYDLEFAPAVPNTSPFPDNPNYDWQRGRLLKEQVYNEPANFQPARLVKEIIYHFSNYLPENRTEPTKIYGYKITPFYPLNTNGDRPRAYVFRMSKYTILTDVAKILDSKREIFYDVADASKKVEVQTSYSYLGQKHMQPSRIVVTDSKGQIATNNFYYSQDFTDGTLGSNLLRNLHIHSKPVSEVTLINGVPLSKTEIPYSTINAKVQQNGLVKYVDGVNESLRKSYNYDSYGNLTMESQLANPSDIPRFGKSYIWGYNHRLPIAEVLNALPNQIYHTSFEDMNGSSVIGNDGRTGKKCWSGNFTIPQDQGLIVGNYQITYWEKIGTGNWTFKSQTISNATPTSIISTGKIDEIRIYPTGAQMTTFTYDPLIGMTSKTDPNSLTFSYRYDDLGRLRLMIDQNGNISKVYEYGYQIK